MNERLAYLSVQLYTVALPFAWLAVAALVVVGIPVRLFGDRKVAGQMLFQAAYLFGFTTWMLGAALTFASFGWVGLLVGLMVFGVGVVPIGIVAAIVAFHDLGMALTLFMMTVITWICRLLGVVWKTHDIRAGAAE
jgi:hypothetical protein